MASGNRYLPFTHGPLNLSTPGPKSVTPGWPTCPLRTASSRDACGTPVCRSTAEMWHFFSRSKVHGRNQNTVESRYLHMALLLCSASLHSLLNRSLVSKLFRSPSLIFKLSCSPSLVSKLSWSPSLVSKLCCSPSSPRRAVTTRIRRVYGKRPAICCCCSLDLWGVIQLLTSFSSWYLWLRSRRISLIYRCRNIQST